MQELYGFFFLTAAWMCLTHISACGFFFFLDFVSFSCRCSFITLSQRAHWISAGGDELGLHVSTSECQHADELSLNLRFNLSPFRWKSTFRQDPTQTFFKHARKVLLWNSRERDPSNDTCTSNPIFPENEKLSVRTHTHISLCNVDMSLFFGGKFDSLWSFAESETCSASISPLFFLILAAL